MVPLSRACENAQRGTRIRSWGAALAIAIGVLANASFAQDNDKAKAGLELWKTTGCPECHGSFADGDKQRDDAPTGANLRTTRLDAAALKEVISCGRPGGAGMPSFDEDAYKVRACYGRPLGSRPDDLYPTSRTLTPDEIDTVIAYLQARVIGRGRVTKQECLFYFSDRSDECEDIN